MNMSPIKLSDLSSREHHGPHTVGKQLVKTQRNRRHHSRNFTKDDIHRFVYKTSYINVVKNASNELKNVFDVKVVVLVLVTMTIDRSFTCLAGLFTILQFVLLTV